MQRNGEFTQFSASDTEELFELDRICRLSPWSLEGFRSELEQSYTYCWGERNSEGIIAFIMSHVLIDEAHILKIGVAPEHRRRGLATRLFQFAVERFANLGVQSAYLEVRRSQQDAQGLYHKLGFLKTGERKNYYGSDEGYGEEPEDAILFRLNL